MSQPWSIAFSRFATDDGTPTRRPRWWTLVETALGKQWDRVMTFTVIDTAQISSVDICFVRNPDQEDDLVVLNRDPTASNSGIRVLVVDPGVSTSRTNSFENRYTVTTTNPEQAAKDLAEVIRQVTYRLKLKSLLDRWSEYIQLQPSSEKLTPSSDLILQKLGIPITLVKHVVGALDNGRPSSVDSLTKPMIIGHIKNALELQNEFKDMDSNTQGSYIYTLPVSALTAETNLHGTWLKMIRSNPELRVVLVITEGGGERGERTSQEEIMRKGCEQLNLLYPFRGHLIGGSGIRGGGGGQKEKEIFLDDLKECLNELKITSDGLYDSLRG